MEASELIRLNHMIKRRLQIEDHRTSSYLVDSLGRKVEEADLMGLDILNVYDTPKTAQNDKRFLLRDILDLHGSQSLSREEAKILLGYDFKTVADDLDITVMLEALRGGFGGARTNAYVLGANITSDGIVRVPVAFYTIPKKIHQSLSNP